MVLWTVKVRKTDKRLGNELEEYNASAQQLLHEAAVLNRIHKPFAVGKEDQNKPPWYA